MHTASSHKQTMELLEKYSPFSVFHQLRSAILSKICCGQEAFPHIHGRRPVKDDISMALLSGTHPYLISEEGTGKTRLARSIARLLPPVPRIAGCPYNDDPKWPKTRLCPRCRASNDPVADFGIEWITGEQRFSRIQGNEYTNEAKLLGLKDIQAIASGMSPSDPQTFSGTGVFRANRGILFVDELPAIRTKVQVLLHPIIEEKMAVLEEYGFEYPLDLCLVATGNPEGFAHVNEVPRPLTDRLETIYMDLPDEDTEFSIMIMERFQHHNGESSPDNTFSLSLPDPRDASRQARAPWWLLTAINKAVRQSRSCRWLERPSHIRGTVRALDHTLSSAELAGHPVAGLTDGYRGLRLSLRGRVHLRQDLIEIDNPRDTYRKVDELTEDLLRTALADLGESVSVPWNENGLVKDVSELSLVPIVRWPLFIKDRLPAIGQIIADITAEGERLLHSRPEELKIGEILAGSNDPGSYSDEYVIATAELIAATCAIKGWLKPEVAERFSVPKEISWHKGRSER